MWRYIVRRILLQGIPVLLGFTFLLYLIITIAPGSPVTHLRGVPELDTSVIAQREAQLGLDQPFIVQYLQWLGRVIRLDLGLSFDSARRPVVTLIAERMPATVILSLSSSSSAGASAFRWAYSPPATNIPSLTISSPFLPLGHLHPQLLFRADAALCLCS